MKDKNYIVLRVDGNWIAREQVQVAMKQIVEGRDPKVDVLDDGYVGVKTYVSKDATLMQDISAKDPEGKYLDSVEDALAADLGRHLRRLGLLKFDVSRERAVVKFSAEVVVIRDKEDK